MRTAPGSYINGFVHVVKQTFSSYWPFPFDHSAAPGGEKLCGHFSVARII